MAKGKGLFGGGEQKKEKKEVSRGTQDELEIVMLIVAASPALRQAVLEKIRQSKYRMGAKPTAQDADGAAKKAK